MEEMNEMTVMSTEKITAACQVMETGMSYTSVNTEDVAGKIALYNAMANPGKKLKEMVNTPIKMKDVVVEPAAVRDDEGMENIVPRIILIAEDGTTYSAMSVGMYTSLKRIFRLFGTPDSWTAPLTVVPKLISTKKGQVLTLELK